MSLPVPVSMAVPMSLAVSPAPSRCCCGDQHLSTREGQLLELVAAGSSDRQIASALHISPHTVHSYLAALRAKLGACSRADLVARSYVLGLLVVDAWPPASGALRCSRERLG